LALTWAVWQQRNKIIFSNETFDGNKVMDDAIFYTLDMDEEF